MQMRYGNHGRLSEALLLVPPNDGFTSRAFLLPSLLTPECESGFPISVNIDVLPIECQCPIKHMCNKTSNCYLTTSQKAQMDTTLDNTLENGLSFLPQITKGGKTNASILRKVQSQKGNEGC